MQSLTCSRICWSSVPSPQSSWKCAAHCSISSSLRRLTTGQRCSFGCLQCEQLPTTTQACLISNNSSSNSVVVSLLEAKPVKLTNHRYTRCILSEITSFLSSWKSPKSPFFSTCSIPLKRLPNWLNLQLTNLNRKCNVSSKANKKAMDKNLASLKTVATTQMLHRIVT